MKLSITTDDPSQFGLGIFMLVAAVVLPSLLILAWIILFKKTPRQRRRRRRGRERPMNPTLDRTGGLPPIRRQEEADQT